MTKHEQGQDMHNSMTGTVYDEEYARWLVSQYVPVAGGATNNFIPTVWAARMDVWLAKALVYAQQGVVNRDWEGEIQNQGDTVKINDVGEPTITKYTKNTDMPGPETLDDDQKQLTITEADMFNFQVDDIDKAQQKPATMDRAMQKAAYGLAVEADLFVAGKMAQATQNVIGDVATPIVPTPTAGANGAYEQLVDLGVKLDENNVPPDNRWAVVPPWFHGLLTKDNRFISYQAITVLYNRQVGEAAGFRVMSSNNVPTVAAPTNPTTNPRRYVITAGTDLAFSYAEQVNKVEAYRPEKRFSDAIKGLHLYGGDLLHPEAVANLYAAQTTDS